MTSPDAGYTPYDLMRCLIERVGWPTETEKQAALTSVDAWERVNLFGNLAVIMKCPHDNTRWLGGRWGNMWFCDDCGRSVTK